MQRSEDPFHAWLVLDYAAWRDTLATFHLWTQIVGKTRLALSPWLNHGWQVPLYVDAHGLGTSPIDVDGELLEIAFDLVEHRLVLRSSHAPDRGFALEPMSVARFHERFMRELRALGIDVTIGLTPNEVPHPIRFVDDEVHARQVAQSEGPVSRHCGGGHCLCVRRAESSGGVEGRLPRVVAGLEAVHARPRDDLHRSQGHGTVAGVDDPDGDLGPPDELLHDDVVAVGVGSHHRARQGLPRASHRGE